MLAGFVYGIYVAYLYPHLYNYLILGIYLVITLGKLWLMIPRKTVGVIKFTDGKPAVDIEIGLFDTEFKNLLFRTFTSKNGEYSFVVPNRAYNLKIMDDRYKVVTGNGLTNEIHIIPRGNENVRVITTNLTLQ